MDGNRGRAPPAIPVAEVRAHLTRWQAEGGMELVFPPASNAGAGAAQGRGGATDA